MKHLLPIPTREHIPPFEGAEPLTRMLDRQYTEWFNETRGIEDLKNPAKAPAQFLDIFGEMLAADIQDIDSERTKRIKIMLAQNARNLRGAWASVKQVIDSVIGADSILVTFSEDADAFSVIGEETPNPNWTFEGRVYNAIQGIVTVATTIGMRISAVADESSIEVTKGVFMINIGITNATFDQIEILKISLRGRICAYFKIILGYNDPTAGFQPYPNGEIN